jgi:hypothetical protein
LKAFDLAGNGFDPVEIPTTTGRETAMRPPQAKPTVAIDVYKGPKGGVPSLTGWFT